MAMIPQPGLFGWNDVDELGDLERLKLVLDTMPDEQLMRMLEKKRGKTGRNDYPVRAVWNSVLAGIIFQHVSIESLRRELQRNAQLRELCGFEVFKGTKAVPTADAYTGFLSNLMDQQDLVDGMLENLVSRLRELLPDFGQELAFDSKAIDSLAVRLPKKGSPDLRRDNDADWGVKRYKGVREDGSLWEKTKKWFGYKLHLVVDANYELPVAYKLTKASLHDAPVMREVFDGLSSSSPDLLEDCQFAMGDKGYDNAKTISQLFETYAIKPIIDIRSNWKDPDQTRIFAGRSTDNLTFDVRGKIFCHCPKTDAVLPMVYAGFETDRGTLKYRCPAKEYGFECPGAAACPIASGVRISLDENPRRFTPLPRSTHKWKRLYNKRTSVERVNSRLDVSFGFERHFIRGMTKMRMRCGLSLCVMLSMAVGRIEQQHPELMRSLIKAA